MYFIMETTIDDKEVYQSARIVSHTKSAAQAAVLLQKSAIEYVKEECGNQAAAEAAIIEIKNFNQVNEPLTDKMLIYRLNTQPHTLHIYQRKTKEVPGYIYGKTTVTVFKKVKVFNLIEYSDINSNLASVPLKDTVQITMSGKGSVLNNNAPINNLLDSLKKSPKFQSRYESSNAKPDYPGKITQSD